VLAIRIYLQRVREAAFAGGAKSGQHRRALAAIHRVSQQRDIGPFAQPLQLARASIVAAIVDQKHRQAVNGNAFQHSADRAFVVVNRNDHAG
jgi:hypothetical protein